jgi:DNA repair exonuclease SbcCD nuclease subunit
MSKLLLYADPHICTNSSVIRSRGDKYSTRLEYLKKTFDWINETAKVQNCERIICLGDLFDSCNLTAEEITAVQDFNLAEHYFIVGNHDSNKKDLSYNAVNIFKPNHVITTPTTLFLWQNIFLLPYTNEPKKEDFTKIKEITAALENNTTIILSHNDLKGVNYGGYISEFGYDLEDINNNCSLFINGHIHNGSWVNNKILNLGSVTGLNFSNNCLQNNWKPSIAILDTETLKVELIENPYAFLFYTVQLKSKEEIDNFIDTLQFDRPNVVSMKVPSSLGDYAKEVQEFNSDLFLYCRIVLDYSDQKVIVNTETENHFTSLNHYDKLKQFVAQKFDTNSINYKIMMEEIEGIRQ